ncbi:MAG: M3 family oligoendopeptidase [Acidibacillus sp.]|nr:M3 family oligoendopeptidase [Acidibacillus sp.]
MTEYLNQTWDLESIFAGGSHSVALMKHLELTQSEIDQLQADIIATDAHADALAWSSLLYRIQDVSAKLREAGAFCGCLVSQNVRDEQAKLLSGRTTQLSASLTSAYLALDAKLLEMNEDTWNTLLNEKSIEELRFNLKERRMRASDRLDQARETLIADLSVDGYHAWSRLYRTVVSRMTLPFSVNGTTVALSMGQAANKLMDPDRAVRSATFKKWEDIWTESEDLCASALNHIAGYKLALYKHRGWDSVLHEPLQYNRMTERTLQVMWDVIEQHHVPFVDYLHRKAKLFGVEKLSWHDVAAPLGEGSKTYTYEQAAEFIVEQFGKFSTDMADFAQKALRNRWVEAQDRAGKDTGGYCTSFPVSEQSRIFMTFSGTFGNVSTLAHELGHAYHQSVMRGIPIMAKGYAMNVAETASTMAERIVTDAAVKHATDPHERLALLEDKVQQAATMFMNIRSRFLFETRFYEQRRKGLVGASELSEIMEQAQRDAFHHSLGEYHPHFWASKQHFYGTGVPFYNFPYTFGYLFSNGIYALAQEEGPQFADKYVALLRDTGRMTVEDLARKHLGVDLTKADFWEHATRVAITDATEFMQLTEHM